MIAEKEVYGIICLDRQEADIALVVGKKIKPMAHFESIVPGKTRAGGQSAMRFSRVREGLLQDWYKQVSEAANAIFSEQPELRGIIIGGPGPTKEAFLKSELLHAELRKKILGIIDTSYTGEYGVEETLARSEELIRETEIMKEKSLMQRFFEELQKPAGLVVYGLNETLTALKMGAIDQLLLSEGVPYKEVEWECGCGRTKEFLHENKITERKGLPCEKCGQPKQLVAETDAADALEELAKQFGTKFILVSVDTREGQQFAELGGIGGFLRYRV
jgi:peptide chain release factor subunit 1